MASYNYHYNYNFSGGSDPNRNRRDPQKNELASWLFIVLMLGFIPPVGVLMLFVKLFGDSGTRRAPRMQHPYDIQNGQQRPGARTVSSGAAESGKAPSGEAPSAPQSSAPRQKAAGAAKSSWTNQANRKKASSLPGKGLTIAGAIITGLFGFVSIMEFLDLLFWANPMTILRDMVPLLCFLGGGIGLLWAGLRKQKKARRYRKYLSLIGKRKTISISALAQAMPASPATVRNDLEDMLDGGYFPAGYLDYGDDELVLTDAGLQDDEPPAEEKPADPVGQEDAILAEIRAVNDSIAHPELSRQIKRIEEITAKIFEYQKTHPEKASQLRTFLGYYLPATLKILHAYARLESQGVEGENITAAKGRIEDMMSKVVEGFEKQLDQLFQNDAMDITTDVAVLEQMLSKDGLSSGDGLQLGL